MDEIWKLYLTYFSSHVHFSKLEHSCKWQSMIWPDLDLGRWSNWGRGVYYWKVLPKGRCGPNIKASSRILQQLRRLFKTLRQNSNMGLNDKVWPNFDLGRGQTEERVCAIERSYPNVVVGQILKPHLEYICTSAVTNTFQNLNSELEHGFKWQSMTWSWPRQKVKLRKGCVLLIGLTLRLVWSKY